MPRRKMVPPTVVVAATRSASDTNFLCDNREWFRLQRSMRQQGPRPILIFVAAKGNGFAYSCRSGNEVRIRFHSSLRQRRMVPPATVVAATRSASDSILRCGKGEWFRLQNATTPRLQRFMISGVKLGNRCKIMPVYDLLRAVIRNFRGQTWESLQDFPQKQS